MSGLLLEGTLYLKRTAPTTVATAGFVKAGNTVKAEIGVETETKELISKMKGSYGSAINSIVIPKPAKLTATANELADKKMLAMALLGVDSNVTVTAGTVASETFTAVHDQWIPLVHSEISDVVITDKTLGTDYEVNATLGWIMALSTGSIVNNAVTTVAYDYDAKSGWKVRGSVEPIIKCEVQLEGRNLADGKNVIFHAHQWSVAPSGALNLLGDNFVEINLAGSLELPSGKTEPFTIEYY